MSNAILENHTLEQSASQESSCQQSNGDQSAVATPKELSAAKQYKAPIAKRISARSPILQPSPAYSLRSQISTLRLDSQDDDDESQSSTKSEHVLFTQVLDWLRQQQSKRTATDLGTGAGSIDGPLPLDDMQHSPLGMEKSLALDQLGKILHHYAVATSKEHSNTLVRQPSRRHRSGRGKGLRRGSGSDSDHYDESSVPSVDAALDNTKTLGYSGGISSENVTSGHQQSRVAKESNHWLNFKAEILRLVHTLRLKGWRRVGMESCGDIEVTRLSGALTNAVYVVKPPKLVLQNSDSSNQLVPRRPPP